MHNDVSSMSRCIRLKCRDVLYNVYNGHVKIVYSKRSQRIQPAIVSRGIQAGSEFPLETRRLTAKMTPFRSRNNVMLSIIPVRDTREPIQPRDTRHVFAVMSCGYSSIDRSMDIHRKRYMNI